MIRAEEPLGHPKRSGRAHRRVRPGRRGHGRSARALRRAHAGRTVQILEGSCVDPDDGRTRGLPPEGGAPPTAFLRGQTTWAFERSHNAGCASASFGRRGPSHTGGYHRVAVATTGTVAIRGIHGDLLTLPSNLRTRAPRPTKHRWSAWIPPPIRVRQRAAPPGRRFGPTRNTEENHRPGGVERRELTDPITTVARASRGGGPSQISQSLQ